MYGNYTEIFNLSTFYTLLLLILVVVIAYPTHFFPKQKHATHVQIPLLSMAEMGFFPISAAGYLESLELKKWDAVFDILSSVCQHVKASVLLYILITCILNVSLNYRALEGGSSVYGFCWSLILLFLSISLFLELGAILTYFVWLPFMLEDAMTLPFRLHTADQKEWKHNRKDESLFSCYKLVKRNLTTGIFWSIIWGHSHCSQRNTMYDHR